MILQKINSNMFTFLNYFNTTLKRSKYTLAMASTCTN